MARSRQSQTGALVPYARGTLRLQHVTFFNWCEPPMGASLSVSMGLISPERRNLFPSDPGVAPRPCAVPCGRLAAGSRLAPSPCRAGSCRLRPLRWWSWVPAPRVLLVLVRACPEVLLVRQLCLALCVNTKLEMTSAMAWTVLRASAVASRRARSTFRQRGHHCCGVSPMGGAIST